LDLATGRTTLKFLIARGSAVAKITAENLTQYGSLFHPILNLWVYEEIVNGEKLSSVINTKRENIKYVSLATQRC